MSTRCQPDTDGTRDAIAAFSMKEVWSTIIRRKFAACVCFVDYEKAFDRVDWSKLMQILESIGVD